MFASRKWKKWVDQTLATRTSDSTTDRLMDDIRELRWRIESLEAELKLTYETVPSKRHHFRKDGPERG